MVVNKKSMAGLLLLLWLALLPAQAEALSPDSVKPALDKSAEYLLALEKSRDKPLTPWSYLALAAAGRDLAGTRAVQACGQQLDAARATADYSLLVFTLLACGEDPGCYRGQDLVQKIREAQLPDGKFADNIDRSGQGDHGQQVLLNSHVWAVLALCAAGVEIPEAPQARQWIIDRQHADGSFNWLVSAKGPDVDSTGMALMALGALGEGKDSPVVQRACGYLKSVQEEDGGYSSWGEANPESCSMVIGGLIAVGMDPAGEMNGSGGNPVTAVLGFRLTDGSFAHIGGGAANEMATQQALLALSDVYYGKPWHQRLRERRGTPAAGAGAAGLEIRFKVGSPDYQVRAGGRSRTERADVAPFEEGGRVYVPVRYLATALGIPGTGVHWSPADQRVTLADNDRTIAMAVDRNVMWVNGTPGPAMDVAPVSREGRVCLPARYVAEFFGCRVSWDEASQMVMITQE